jgi:uncharacterized protein YgiM (DUF1202 family)
MATRHHSRHVSVKTDVARTRAVALRRRRNPHMFVAFLLVASFGILFAGCNGPDTTQDDITFTQDDAERYRELADQQPSSASGAVSSQADIEPINGTGDIQMTNAIDLDLSLVDTYSAMRAQAEQGNVFQVNNEFLNIRTEPNTTSQLVARLNAGDSAQLIEFLDSQWAKVKTGAGQEGYAAHQYLSKVTTDERLEAEKKQFEGMYYVSYGFVNVRAGKDQQSEKLGEIPGKKIIRLSGVEGEWAKLNFAGKEGYVSMSYLAPFLPKFVVRQDKYDLPVLHYRLASDQTDELLALMAQHVNALRGEGYKTMTMRDLHTLVMDQQKRDVRLDPKRIVVAISGITPDNLRAVSDALTTNAITATLFIETQHVGLSGITEKRVMTLLANGFDLQSATHTGDDLRALTNAQVELEMKQSRKILEEMTKKPVFAVAYPQGGVNDRVAQIAARAGYLFGVGDDADPAFTRGQFLTLPAMTVFPSVSVEEVKKFVTGQ